MVAVFSPNDTKLDSLFSSLQLIMPIQRISQYTLLFQSEYRSCAFTVLDAVIADVCLEQTYIRALESAQVRLRKLPLH